MSKQSTLGLVAHLSKQLILPGAASIAGPLKSRISDFIRADKSGQLFERAGENRFVATAIMGWTEGAAHRMIDEDCARRRDFAHDVMRRADHHCWNALAFNDVGDETDGLMAKGSIGHEQREVDLGVSQVVRNRRCQVIFNLSMVTQAAHKRNVKWRQSADDAAHL